MDGDSNCEPNFGYKAIYTQISQSKIIDVGVIFLYQNNWEVS